jgi:large subunit ribosomal protein L18
MNHKPTTTSELRKRRQVRIRALVKGTAARPRLAVFRSNRFVSAQLIDDTVGKTLAAAHGRDFSAKGGKLAQSVQAKEVGSAIAKAAKAKGVTSAVFDRGGYRYAGQVKALADAAREGGLAF